jgi:murein DD-endopeptidase MepM/ murein hydrolase activator NlpD
MGPASVKWFISESERDLFSYETTVTLKFPEPELPEPAAPVTDGPGGGVDDGYFGDIIDQLNALIGDATSGTGAGASSTNAKWAWPVRGNHHINSGFGARVAPTKGASTFHQGIDIEATEGQSVYATRDGTITYAGAMSGYGNVIIIAHKSEQPVAGPYLTGDKRTAAGQTESRYGHLSSLVAAPGLQVKQGQLIGNAGHTGNVTGPHLHFELRRGLNGTALDPLPILLGIEQL